MNRIDPSYLLPESEYIDNGSITLDTIIPTSDVYLRQALLEVHMFKCFYSRDPITADTFHIEHIYPRSLGGRDCIGNYVPANIRMNMMKMVAYDEVHTKQLLAINGLTFARKVLKRYLQLKRAAQKKYPQIEQVDHKKYLHTVKVPRGFEYSGGEFIDLVIQKSKNAIYRNLIERDMRKPKIDDDYVIELILNQKEDIEFLFDKFGPIGLNRGVLFSESGVLIPEYLTPRLYGGASMVSMSHNPDTNLLSLYVNSHHKSEKYPKDSDAMRYFRELSQKIESIIH